MGNTGRNFIAAVVIGVLLILGGTASSLWGMKRMGDERRQYAKAEAKNNKALIKIYDEANARAIGGATSEAEMAAGRAWMSCTQGITYRWVIDSPAGASALDRCEIQAIQLAHIRGHRETEKMSLFLQSARSAADAAYKAEKAKGEGKASTDARSSQNGAQQSPESDV